MSSSMKSRFALTLAVIGFMLIIATGMDLLLRNDAIPIIVSFIGLACIIIATVLRK